MGALTTDGQATTVTQATVATEVHEPLDVHRDLTTKVAFDLEVLIDALTDRADVVLVEIVRLLVGGDARDPTDLVRAVITDSKNVLECDDSVFATRKVYASDTCHGLTSVQP
jgi:hypothetical protein